MKKILVIFVVTFVMFIIIQPAYASTVYAPIYHEQYFKTESDLFNYNPGFEPNIVSFDCNNHPYIRTPNTGKLQTMDDAGNWVISDLVASARTTYRPDLNNNKAWELGNSGLLFRDTWVNEDRIVFDDKCNAYTYLDTTVSSLKQGMLLYSKDRGKTWITQLIPQVVPGMMATLEYKSGSNNIVGPPSLLIHRYNSNINSNEMYVTKPIMSSDGSLTIPIPTLLVSDSLLTGQHSGAGSNIVTRDDKSYIAYPSKNENYCVNQVGKTPTLIVEYENVTKTVKAPKFLGCGIGDTSADPHENPALVIDSHGYLHVVLGAHHQQFQYTKSTKPYDISSWTSPVAIGEPKDDSGSYTYISLSADSSNTLHLVARWAGRDYYFRLIYMRKPENKPWDKFVNSNPNNLPGGTNNTLLHKELVIPWHQYYAVWRHKLSIDNNGRLYLNYSTLGWQYNDKEAVEYQKKWPKDNLAKDDPNCVTSSTKLYCDYSKTAKEHGPVLMASEDKGTTWYLVNSQDLKHFTLLTPTSTPTSIPGDADGDGVVNQIDYLYYVTAVNGGKIPEFVNPDFNGDGEVGAADRIIIIKSLKGN